MCMSLRLLGWHFLILGMLLLPACSAAVLPPPVTIYCRDSLLGAGIVVQIYNESPHHLYNVRVVGRNFENVTSASVKAVDHLAPGGIVEVGWLEFGNWIPMSGETVEVYADNYLLPAVSILP